MWTPLAPLACNLRPRLTAYLYFKGHPKEQSCSTKYLFSEDQPPWPGLSMGQWSQGWGIFYLVSFSFSLETGNFRDLARQSFSTLALWSRSVFVARSCPLIVENAAASLAFTHLMPIAHHPLHLAARPQNVSGHALMSPGGHNSCSGELLGWKTTV